MKKIILVFVIALLSHFNNSAMATDDEFLKSYIDSVCGNKKYIECMKISKCTCKEHMNYAYNNCPLIAIDGLDIKVVSPACFTDKFVGRTNASDATIKNCDNILEEERENRLSNE